MRSLRVGVDHRADEAAGILGGADPQAPGRLDQPGEERVVDRSSTIAREQAEHFCPA